MCVTVFVCACTLTSSPLSCGAVAYALLPWFWSNWTECVAGRREVMGESRKRGGGGAVLGGGCLSLWIGPGWFTSSGHWWLPLPCCKTSSCGPAWTLVALCPTLTGNIPPKVLLPPPLSTLSIPNLSPSLCPPPPFPPLTMSNENLASEAKPVTDTGGGGWSFESNRWD